jgi:glyoxylase-like metal-dependent hydrolase (beta-lactamase superfamily II)
VNRLAEKISKNECNVFPVIVPYKFNELKSINYYLVKTRQSLTLIDAGINNQDCWEALLLTLKKNDLNLQDITEIILTHHHFDHVGLVDRIVSEHPVPVYASPHSVPRLKREKSFLEKRVEFFRTLYKEMDCGEIGENQVAILEEAIQKNKHLVVHSDIIEITEDHLLHFKIIDVPGHAQDHIAIWDEQRNWVFSGDLLIEHISSNALVEPNYHGNRIHTLSQQRDSLLRCASLNANLLYPGHGKIIENPNLLINKRVQRIADKAEKLLQLIRSGITTANALAVTFYKKTYYEQFSLVMSEIISYLDFLEDNGKVKKDYIKGVYHYSVT